MLEPDIIFQALLVGGREGEKVPQDVGSAVRRLAHDLHPEVHQ